MRLKQYIQENITQHLADRGIDLSDFRQYPVYTDTKADVAYFPLFNMSGKFVGYQRYNPDGIKGKDSYKVGKEFRKYYTYVTRENPEQNIPHIAIYGLHTIEQRKGYVFITEGIFDAVKLINNGEPAVAVLSNNPKQLRNFFFALGKTVIAIMDRDSAGSKLRRIADYAYTVPDGYEDLGDMSADAVRKFLKGIMRK